MSTLQEQLNGLSAKVDELHQLIEQLSGRVSDIVTECRLGLEPAQQSGPEMISNYRSPRPNATKYNFDMEHKDVLVDGKGADVSNQNTERLLSPEVQIQRLTAQLTAAYSRIAALEEQLISQRIHGAI